MMVRRAERGYPLFFFFFKTVISIDEKNEEKKFLLRD
jgi:hypothetical protein